MTPRNIFNTELANLTSDVENMARLVEDSYNRLLEAWQQKDEETMQVITQEDKSITGKLGEIESRCVYIITKQQPIVKDLRIITSHMKAATDIKRVGNIISDMAEILLRLQTQNPMDFSSHVEGMMLATKEMYTEAIKVFSDSLTEQAYKTIEHDDVIDGLFNKVKTDIIDSLKKESKDADGCVDVLMLAKYLEKIADHAANICEWEIYRETGELVHS